MSYSLWLTLELRDSLLQILNLGLRPGCSCRQRKKVSFKVRAVEHNHYVGGKIGTHEVQPGSQQLVFILEGLVLHQELVVHLITLSDARLKRASVSIVGEDSRRVIFTRPSFDYSTRISGTGDSEITMLL